MKSFKRSQPAEPWQILHSWLSLTGSSVNSKYLHEELLSHPDYPALTSITDFLDSGGFSYNAVQANISHINYFNYPLIAVCSSSGKNYLHILKEASCWSREKQMTEDWKGIVLFADNGANWHNEANLSYEKNALKNKMTSWLFIVAGLFLFGGFAYHSADIYVSIYTFFSLLGLIVSILILYSEIGYDNETVKQVCGAFSKGGCDEVLNSHYARGPLGFTHADAAVVYFGGQYIALLVGVWSVSIQQNIFIFSLLGVPIAFWSIYTQAIKIKKWCTLCLALVMVLIIQVIVASIGELLILNIANLFIPLLLWMFVALILVPYKSILDTNTKNSLKVAELKKWKKDVTVFESQLQNEISMDSTIFEKELVLGNKKAPIHITVACNPYCYPCSKAHKKLDKLIHRFPELLKVRVRFVFTNHENERDFIAVKSILQLAEELNWNEHRVGEMLDDWFQLMNYDKWRTKWSKDNSIDVTDILLQHRNWVNKTQIHVTPTIFLNGKRLPKKYKIEDLEYLLPEMAERFVMKGSQEYNEAQLAV